MFKLQIQPMEAPKIKVVLYTSKTYKDGTHPIMIRLTQNRKASYIAVGFSVSKDSWDEDSQRVYEKYPKISKRQEGQLNSEKLLTLRERYKHAIVLSNAGHINSEIATKLSELSDISQRLRVNEESLATKNIKNKLNGNDVADRRKSFLVFAKGHRDNYFKTKSIATYKKYKTVLSKLDEYNKNKDILFLDITPQFLKDYEAFLINKGNITSTITANMKVIRAIYYAAIAEQIITADKNPFFIYKLKTDSNTKKEKLTIDEIVRIEQLALEDDKVIWHVRNFFLFSFYCAGIRASDGLQLKWSNISGNGRVEYKMEKTGQFKSISLSPKASKILKQYKLSTSKPHDYIFPFLDSSLDLKNDIILFKRISSCTSLVNKYLKVIGKYARIDKAISTHIARHSFADIARKRKASIYDISKMLGHSSIKMTEAYLASFDEESQDEALKNILDF